MIQVDSEPFLSQRFHMKPSKFLRIWDASLGYILGAASARGKYYSKLIDLHDPALSFPLW